jgi:signal transduction histidine kinase
VQQELTTAASSRLELRLRRLFAFTLALSTIESTANAITQAGFLNPLSWVILAVLLAIVLAIQISTLTKSKVDKWIYLLGFFGVAGMLIFPWAVVDVDVLPVEYQPWLWWVIGMCSVAMGVVARPSVAIGYLVLITAIWLWLDTSAWGGSSVLFVEIQDATYLFLFGGTVLGLLFLVRDSVLKVDRANSLAISSAVEQAQIDAIERERQRIDALIHDRVLNTLLLSAKAKTPEERASVVRLSKEAIESLRSADLEPEKRPAIQPLGLFRALRRAALQLIPSIEVEIISAGPEPIPSAVADAITEALVQALDNAARHSKATKIQLTMDSPTPGSLSIELKDNGVGFRPGRIPRDRIGVQVSILKRIETVGATAQIESEPGSGTTVRLGWKA